MSATGLKIIIVVAYIFMVVMNGLANALPFFGRTTGEVSEAFPNLVTPLGYAFSIWGLIYILLGLMVIKIVTLNPGAFAGSSMRLFLYAFIASSILNAGWLLAWHALRPGIALAVMLALLLSLIVAYLFAPDEQLLKIPFSIYLGWISVATLLNITIVFSVFGLEDLVSSYAYVIGVLLIGIIAALSVLALRGDVPYSLVFVWAYTAIFLRHLSQDNTALYASAGLLGIFILFMAVLTVFHNGYALYGD